MITLLNINILLNVYFVLKNKAENLKFHLSIIQYLENLNFQQM